MHAMVLQVSEQQKEIERLKEDLKYAECDANTQGIGIEQECEAKLEARAERDAALRLNERMKKALEDIISKCAIPTYDGFVGLQEIAKEALADKRVVPVQLDCVCGRPAVEHGGCRNYRPNKPCPSTYTHSSLGKLACEKDEAHLHRIGDVEHRRGRTVWFSL